MWIFYVLLSALCWGLVNVLDSMLVYRYRKHAMVLMWSQAIFSVSILLIARAFYPFVAEGWVWPLLGIGIFSYTADLYFFRVLKKIDVSVVNGAWVIQSLYLSIIGFFAFHETWTMQETIGAILIVVAVTALSFWHKRLPWSQTLGMLVLLGLLYSPNYVMQKYAVLHNVAPLSIFFWSLLGRESCSVCVPWTMPTIRTDIRRLLSVIDILYFCINAAVIFFFFSATYFWILAFQSGPLSLASIVGNIQPFFVIGAAWLFHAFLPRYAPLEDISHQSIATKIISFSVAFIGLALLALS